MKFCIIFANYSLVVLITILMASFSDGELIVNLTSRNDGMEGPMKSISYCVDCPSPEREGSLAQGLNAKHGLQSFTVTGEVVYCVPNHAEDEFIMNGHHLEQRIVLVDRGKEVSFYDKIRRIQLHDALAVLIADDGSCDESFRYCTSKTGTVLDGGFAAQDDVQLWREGIRLPVLLVSRDTAQRLRTLMKNHRVDIPGYGEQQVTEHVGAEGEGLHHDEGEGGGGAGGDEL